MCIGRPKIGLTHAPEIEISKKWMSFPEIGLCEAPKTEIYYSN